MDNKSYLLDFENLKVNEAFPDPFTFFNGNPVKSSEDWNRRAEE